ncbi:LOB domain-containing protein 24-like [Pyrus ussuriensis x Pyrus communis]|uniref:LOB domain-containing protein 24-like n=1 Tax=Pyrus ussuriensis x Pyrus communis TaxID=2448454 RepID=A0A5N5G6A3_9ROSA|nr:LOB domain-containing protein 24-like [Pyrus ussuriensis x Pyrus communis]
MSNPTRCAACRFLRTRCPQDCVLAPYFPSSNPERFSCVHRIFGASNQLPVHLREAAADSMFYGASLRVEDPIYGCVRIISQLQHHILEAQSELLKTNGQIASNIAQHQLHQQQQQNAVHGVSYHQDQQISEPSGLSSDMQAFANDRYLHP